MKNNSKFSENIIESSKYQTSEPSNYSSNKRKPISNCNISLKPKEFDFYWYKLGKKNSPIYKNNDIKTSITTKNRMIF